MDTNVSVAAGLMLLAGSVAFLLWLRGVRAVWTPEDVRALLQSVLDGELDSALWDYFISVKIKDERLEEIRIPVCNIWTETSGYYETGHISPCSINANGRSVLESLIERCRKL